MSLKDKIALKKYQQEYRIKNKTKIKQKQADYHQKAFNVWKNTWLIKKYNITLQEYNLMLKEQSNVCKICKKEETAKYNKKIKSLAVDHCHKTNKIRGLLCQMCNTVLGQIQDNIYIIDVMKEYLKGNQR